jgi:hypothetical protein
MASVTVPGPDGSSIVQTFDNGFNSVLAQNIAKALNAAFDDGNLFQATTDGSAAVPTVPGGKVGELIVEPGAAGRSISVPAGYSYVVDTGLGPDTIFGSPNQSIMGGGGTHTIIDPAAIVLGDTSSGSTNNITITGAGDNVGGQRHQYAHRHWVGDHVRRHGHKYFHRGWQLPDKLGGFWRRDGRRHDHCGQRFKYSQRYWSERIGGRWRR